MWFASQTSGGAGEEMVSWERQIEQEGLERQTELKERVRDSLPGIEKGQRVCNFLVELPGKE